MTAEKIFEVHFATTYNTVLITQADVEYYKSEENVMKVEEVEQCQMCGEKTGDLEILSNLARCKRCENNYHGAMQRAWEYESCMDDDY